jgi:AsmA protein
MQSIEDNTEVTGGGESETLPGHARNRRRLRWSFVGVSVLLVLLLTPPLLNVNRLRLRIASSMSATLGRPVHMDKVSVHLLPIPGFTLENLVVSEDPSFGYEPVIRAMKVELTPRLSSLWRRQVEIATIRFEVDDNGSAPSLNLVRNAQGKWNLQSLLMHAAQVNAEPTSQSSAGPAPRFPYIEATGGRVNLKLGDEKQPFSLLDADFALWLPTPESWHVRLEGKPTRTDTNASDTGTVTLEGKLERAAKMGDVPVELRATWHNAPLGEASKLMTGADAGWRGTLRVDASLIGALNSAKLSTQIQLNDLRRADFVPVKLLNVSLECNSEADVTKATLTNPSCTLPTPAPDGQKDAGQLDAIADKVDLQGLSAPGFGATGLRVGMSHVPESWCLDWVRLFSIRVPAKESPRGVVAGSMVLVPTTSDAVSSWQGEFHADLDGGSEAVKKTDGDEQVKGVAVMPVSLPSQIVMTVAGPGPTFTLSPLNLSQFAKLPALVLTGSATARSYSLHLSGSATAPELESLRGMMPALGDGLETAVPELRSATPSATEAAKTAVSTLPNKILKLNVTCTRTWPAPQTCVAAAPEDTKPVRRKR